MNQPVSRLHAYEDPEAGGDEAAGEAA